ELGQLFFKVDKQNTVSWYVRHHLLLSETVIALPARSLRQDASRAANPGSSSATSVLAQAEIRAAAAAPNRHRSASGSNHLSSRKQAGRRLMPPTAVANAASSPLECARKAPSPTTCNTPVKSGATSSSHECTSALPARS